jgi:hemoglobin-like flavoprotein
MGSFDAVRSSFNRCLMADAKIVDRFYNLFLDSHPDIRPMFANTDFDTQKRLLRQGISYVIGVANGAELSKRNLARIRESHSKGKLNIRPELYVYWMQSLMTVVKETDPEMTDDLEILWYDALNAGVGFIKDGYE